MTVEANCNFLGGGNAAAPDFKGNKKQIMAKGKFLIEKCSCEKLEEEGSFKTKISIEFKNTTFSTEEKNEIARWFASVQIPVLQGLLNRGFDVTTLKFSVNQK